METQFRGFRTIVKRVSCNALMIEFAVFLVSQQEIVFRVKWSLALEYLARPTINVTIRFSYHRAFTV